MKPSRAAAVTGLPRLAAAAALVVAAAATDSAGLAGADEPARRERDWSQVQLAWRDDPRPAADLPAGVAPQRRPARRGLRRAIRRGWPLEQATEAGSDAARQTDSAPRPAAPPPPAIPVETTLASPFSPGSSDGDAVSHRDEPYGSAGHPRQRFDMHLPAACSGGGMPLVIWIHGDDWATGSKSDCPIRWLVDEGYAVASIGYRTSDAAVFPAPLDDCRAAVATILRNAELWGIDPERVCLAGSGAGGHLAALVAFTADGAGPEREAVPAVAAVCAVAAPSHLTSLGPAHDRAASPASRLVGGPLPDLREAALQASPLVHASADDPPTLLVHGSADDKVPVDQAVRLDVALDAAGVDCTAVFLDAGHALPLDEASPAGRELLHFLDRVLGPGPTSYGAADPPATRPAAQGPTDRP